MEFNYKTLKKQSKDLDRLSKQIEEINNPNRSFYEDEELFWQPTVDKQGNGYAVIRFLPQPFIDGPEGTPFVQYWRHSVKGPGGWYIENSRTTLGEKDPMSEFNTHLWNNGKQDRARQQARKVTYISNILVVEDPENPENEGKVFYFRYGKQLFNIVSEAMHPQFKDREAYNPFDLEDGANFKIKIFKKGDFRSYEKSEFAAPAPIGKTDAEREEIWKQTRTLKKFVAEDQFKSYSELKTKLERALGIDLDEVLGRKGAERVSASSAPSTRKTVAENIESDASDDTSDVSSDDLAFFRNLAEAD